MEQGYVREKYERLGNTGSVFEASQEKKSLAGLEGQEPKTWSLVGKRDMKGAVTKDAGSCKAGQNNFSAGFALDVAGLLFLSTFVQF